MEPSKRCAPANRIEYVPGSIPRSGSLPYEASDRGRNVPQRVFTTSSGQSLTQDFESSVGGNARFDQVADHEQCDRRPVGRITPKRGNHFGRHAPSKGVGTRDHPWSLSGGAEQFSSPTHPAGELGEGGDDEVGGHSLGGPFERFVVDGTDGYPSLSRVGHDRLDPSHRVSGISLA